MSQLRGDGGLRSIQRKRKTELAYVYIDSDVIVSSQRRSEKNHNESKKFMISAVGPHPSHIKYIISVFTFLEVASAMIRRTHNKHRAYSLLYQIKDSWKRSIKPAPPLATKDLTSFERLVESLVESTMKFRTPSFDSIHAQTIYLYDCDYLVTWNKADFKGLRRRMRKLKILTPTEMTQELNLLSNSP